LSPDAFPGKSRVSKFSASKGKNAIIGWMLFSKTGVYW
jgi:hypothetical protein